MRYLSLLVICVLILFSDLGIAQEGDLAQSIFKARREAFMKKMDGGIAIFHSAPVRNRSNDVDYEYRQDSDFYYLTGFEEPECAFLLAPGQPDHKFVMWLRERDPASETRNGRRLGIEGAMTVLEADTAFAIDAFEKTLLPYARGAKKVYYETGNDEEFEHLVINRAAGAGVYGPDALINADKIVHEMRLFKQPEEIKFLKKSIDITCDSQIEAMKSAEPGMWEYELEAVIEYIYRKNGSHRPGFPSIVGSGPNSTILHYQNNDRQMQAGELVLVDIGAEYGFYSADITRTLPVNGKFSKEQEMIYNIVLDAQNAAMQLIKPEVRYRDVHNKAVEVVTKGLIKILLLEGDLKTNIKNRGYRKFLMHGTGHWLGLDVHDAGDYRDPDGEGSRKLEPGMVFTIEPGIYIAEGTEGVDPKWWNIGVRIEDDYLVTKDGYEWLSEKAPRGVSQIEKLMEQTGLGNMKF